MPNRWRSTFSVSQPYSPLINTNVGNLPARVRTGRPGEIFTSADSLALGSGREEAWVTHLCLSVPLVCSAGPQDETIRVFMSTHFPHACLIRNLPTSLPRWGAHSFYPMLTVHIAQYCMQDTLNASLERDASTVVRGAIAASVYLCRQSVCGFILTAIATEWGIFPHGN